jgi:RNA polymerase sigma-70 factor, ECF subfamily
MTPLARLGPGASIHLRTVVLRTHRMRGVAHPATTGWQARDPRAMEGRLPVRDAPAIDDRAIDAVLLQRIGEGDEAALGQLYERMGRAMYSLAYQIVRDAASAEDVVQEVFLAAWRDAHRFDGARGSAATWLFSLTRHKAIDLLRRETTARTRTVDSDLAIRPAIDDVEQESWLAHRGERARRAVAMLSDDQRQAVELAFFRGLTHVEVADALGIPLGTAKTRIRSGLLRLRHLLADSLHERES